MGMEACASAHHCAREIAKLGHAVRLMPPAYVKPYVKRGKTDAAGDVPPDVDVRAQRAVDGHYAARAAWAIAAAAAAF